MTNLFFSDPIIQNLVAKYPAPKFQDNSDHLYEDLIESIVSQQLSIKAADTIFGRFKELFTPVIANRVKQSLPIVIPAKAGIQEKEWIPDQVGNDDEIYTFPTPHQVLEKSDEELRTAGLSFQKISYIKSVADAFLSDLIDTEIIKQMNNEEVISTLTQIRGVGKWTAEMILIFTLNRPDVFSVGDLGIRNAIIKLYGITDPQEMIKLSEKWQPHRSTACWYLWRSLENTPLQK